MTLQHRLDYYINSLIEAKMTSHDRLKQYMNSILQTQVTLQNRLDKNSVRQTQKTSQT